MKPEISLTIGIWNPRFMDKEYWIQYPPSRIYNIKSGIHNVRSRRFKILVMHLILEECQPVSRRVSFHKRLSSVRKSERDAIGFHIIQAADNVPGKIKFHFLNFPNCIPKFHMSYRSSNSSQWRLHRGILWNTDKYVCSLFGERSERILGWTKVMCKYFLSLLRIIVIVI